MARPVKLLNRRYLTLFLINLIVSISFSMVGTTMSVYVSRSGAAASVVGTVVGMLSIASLCMRPFTGILSDRLERKWLLIISLTLIAAAVLGCSLTTAVPALILFRVLHGIGFSCATTVTLVLAGESIPENRMTQGMAWFALGQTIATAVAPSVGLWCGNRFGFAVAFRAAAGFLLIAVLLAFFLVEASGNAKGKMKKSLKFADFFAVQALPFCLLSAIAAGATGLENGFIALFGEKVGLGNVGWYFTIAAVALLLARLFGGRLTDRHERVMIPGGFLMMTAAFLALGLLTGSAQAGMLAAVFGLASAFKSAGLGIVQPALQAACLRAVPEDRKGSASSTYYLGTDLGQALAPMLGGAVMDRAGMAPMFTIYSAVLLAGFGICMFYWGRKGQEVKA